MSSTLQFPSIDGHFWVVRDGKIIDPVFDEYKLVCHIRNADWKDRHNLPAPEMTQTLMINMFKKILNNQLGKDKSFEELIDEFYALTVLYMKKPTPQADKCFQNCLIEIKERGGDLVFGSLGFKLKCNEGYWYEFGGADWTSVKQFIK